MKHYFGYKYTTKNGTNTLGFIPLTAEAAYQFGYYDFEDDVLTLVSKDSAEELQVFQKMNEFGQAETKQMKGSSRVMPLVERRMIHKNLTFDLKAEATDWFIRAMFENDDESVDILHTVIDEYKKKQAEQSVAEQATHDIVEQPILEEA